jgi:hypothetical protein
MSLFGWLKGNKKGPPSPLDRWRAAWKAAVEGTDERDAELRTTLDSLAPGQPDVEIELEMLAALDQLRAAQRQVATGALPTVETGHRVVGAERCHFSAPASLPGDQAQTAGRVLLTGTKAIFVGGGRTSTCPWHLVHAVARIERDLLLARADGSDAAHFRFNSFGDALVSAFLAQQLKGARRASL